MLQDVFGTILKYPCDGDPLWILRYCLQGGLDCAVGLIQVVVDDGEVEVVAVGCLYFSALVARPVHLFILGQKTGLILTFSNANLLHSASRVDHVFKCKRSY